MQRGCNRLSRKTNYIANQIVSLRNNTKPKENKWRSLRKCSAVVVHSGAFFTRHSLPGDACEGRCRTAGPGSGDTPRPSNTKPVHTNSALTQKWPNFKSCIYAATLDLMSLDFVETLSFCGEKKYNFLLKKNQNRINWFWSKNFFLMAHVGHLLI